MSLHKFGIYMICTNGKQCKCGHTCDFCLLGSLPKPSGTLGQVVPKSRCCVTDPIGSVPYFRPKRCGTYTPKLRVENDTICPVSQSRSGALAP